MREDVRMLIVKCFSPLTFKIQLWNYTSPVKWLDYFKILYTDYKIEKYSIKNGRFVRKIQALYKSSLQGCPSDKMIVLTKLLSSNSVSNSTQPDKNKYT